MTSTPPQRLDTAFAGVAIGGTLIGTAAFVAYNHSWESALRMAYDVPAALASYSYPAMLVAEVVTGRRGPAWWVRLAALAAMTAVTVGREFAGGIASGHITCVIAVAIILSAQARLPLGLRLAYWAAAAWTVGVRLLLINGRFDASAGFGIAAGVLIGVVAGIAVRRERRKRPQAAILLPKTKP